MLDCEPENDQKIACIERLNSMKDKESFEYIRKRKGKGPSRNQQIQREYSI